MLLEASLTVRTRKY